MAAIGEVIWHGGSTAPSGWLLCDGSFVSTTTYAALFAPLGHAFNGGPDPLDGTFKLPDLRDRMVLGKSDSGTGSTRGGTGGAEAHVHTGPSHTHPVTQPSAHGSHTIGQASAHSLTHTGSTVADHALLTHSWSVANHVVGQPATHSTHSSA